MKETSIEVVRDPMRGRRFVPIALRGERTNGGEQQQHSQLATGKVHVFKSRSGRGEFKSISEKGAKVYTQT